ncbi:transmembrane protein 131-like isoform X2 [Microcaecilia unicolor]|uniref:Transmembrane protein 131-like isoform X2 n=1 Tax=Microcaecilia unicolor TaxID=1415580 RepID=A0A6P7X298_9AMPH|nr:transmembrane protein 131-like isoform X2 [Microcaecilia unicolor]
MAGPRSPPPLGSRCHPTVAFNLLLGLLQVLLPCFRQGSAQGQVIDPMPSVVELWQAEEGEPMLPAQADAEQDVEEPHPEQSFAEPTGKALQLHPSTVDFGTQLLGLPRVQLVHAYNPSREREVIVTSVFTATPHFHVSAVQSRVIPAKRKTTFRVIFLPTDEGSMESTLFINTSSHGVLSYPLFGVGVSRDSTAGSKMLLQNTCVLFPHIEHIHLPPVQEEITNTSLLQARLKWAVHYEPKSSCVQAGHTLMLQINLMIRIHGDPRRLGDLRQYILENLFVVCVVTDNHRCSGDSKVTVYALNSGSHLVHIQDIQHLTGSGSSSLKFDPVLLPSSTTNFTEAASITCHATACDGGSSGSAGAERNQLDSSKTLKAFPSFHVTDGYFGIDPSAASFHIQPYSGASGVWSVWLTNNLEFSVVLREVFVAREMKHTLKVLNFTSLLTLPSGCWNVFSLKLSTKDVPMSLFTTILLATNLGVLFEIPLQIHLTLTKKGGPRFEAIAQCDILSYLGKSDAASLRWQESLSLDGAFWSVDSDLGTELYNQYQRIKHGESCRRNVLGMMQSIHRKQHEEGSMAFFLPHLVSEPGSVLNFSATALRNSTVQYFLLRNPSSLPVTVQLLPLSSYPDPHLALGLLRKWFGIDTQTMNLTTAEFQLVRESTQMELQQEDCAKEKSILEVLQLQLQPWESRRIGVFFTPADYKKVTTLILIRNNLTVLDAVPVEGVGVREMLKVGGRLPGTGGSLRFKVPESTLMDCRQQLKDSKQILSIRKNFKVENVGPIPVSISSMKINGYSCQGFGFEVLDCQAFTLPENSSREIGIMFIPDFTSSWVIRELTLVTETDLEFRFTLNVTLPHHLLPLCADGVPGPGWEESFWRMTVLFVSFSLLGVILIAFQQAQYILAEFMKSRHRPNPGLDLHQNSHSVDTIGSDSYRGSCKSFVDSCGSPDKGRGKGFIPVVAAPSRSQILAKSRSTACSHSQKKPKCSFYYNRQKPSSLANSSSPTADAGQQREHTAEEQPSCTKEELCLDIPGDKWTNLNIMNKIEPSVQKPSFVLDKEELVLKAVAAVPSSSSDASLKEELHVCMFPKETDVKTLDSGPELREQALCGLHVPKKLPDNPSPRSPSPSQNQPKAAAQNCDGEQSTVCKAQICVGNNQLVSSRNEKLNCEPMNKLLIHEPPVEKPVHKIPQEPKLCRGRDLHSAEQDDVHWMKRSPEKREGNTSNTNWNKFRIPARKNRKKNGNISTRVPEQTEWKHMCTEFERPELRASSKLRNWYPVGNGETSKTEQKPGRLPAEEETEHYQNSRRMCAKKNSLDSSSECGSSRGSVRASRGSWGSWSSTSSSDGDKKPILLRQVLPSSESMVRNDFPAETQMAVNLLHSVCNTSTDMNVVPHFAETLSPTFADVVAEPEKNKGLYPGEDIWSVQPVCLTTGLNYNLENNAGCVMQENPSVHNSYVEWNATCDGHRLSNMYGPLHMEDYNPFLEENMNYHTGFPSSEVQSPAFVDHSCQSSWNLNSTTPPPPPPANNVPTAWDAAGYPSSSPYLSSTRSLSPMSGLFGSIWAPQNDMYESYFPVSASSAQAEHMENQAVLCKQEYSSRFNPFHAYMNLDLWTTAANRNATFPLSRDTGYCGNM